MPTTRAASRCPDWYHDVMLPQGGLRGTLDDLLSFAEANLAASIELDPAPLARAMRRARELHFACPREFKLPTTGKPPDFVQGLAWRGLEHPGGLAWLDGETTLFYNAGCGVDEHAQVGVAVASSNRWSFVDGEAGA